MRIRWIAVLPIDFVIQEVERLGLSAIEIKAPKQRKWLLIQGRKCQVSQTRLTRTHPKYPHSKAIGLYLPRVSWPDFIVYVTMPQTVEDKPAFYVVPRGAISKDTTWLIDALSTHKDNWHQLLEIQGAKELKRKFRYLTPPLKTVIAEALYKNFSVKLVKKAGRQRLLWFYQHRILIDGVKCIVMSTSRVGKVSDVISVRRPTGYWSSFVIYVAKDITNNGNMFFIIPASEVPETTTRSLKSPSMARYLNAWELISSLTGC
jgi:hypothetical protein